MLIDRSALSGIAGHYSGHPLRTLFHPRGRRRLCSRGVPLVSGTSVSPLRRSPFVSRSLLDRGVSLCYSRPAWIMHWRESPVLVSWRVAVAAAGGQALCPRQRRIVRGECYRRNMGVSQRKPAPTLRTGVRQDPSPAWGRDETGSGPDVHFGHVAQRCAGRGRGALGGRVSCEAPTRSPGAGGGTPTGERRRP